MEKLCIRGGGRLGKKAILEIRELYKDIQVSYVADKDLQKCGQLIEDVLIVHIEDAFRLYKEKKITKYVIIFSYGMDLVKEIIKELLNNFVKEEDILILHNSILEKYRSVKYRLPFHFIDFYSTQEKEILYRKMANEKPIEDFNSKNFIICGNNWLAKYVLENIKKETMEQFDESRKYDNDEIFVICEENFYLKYDLSSYLNSQKINLYNIIFNYFFSNASWFDVKHTELKKKDICGVATGTSTFRDAIKIEYVLNLANWGQDIYYDLQLLKKYSKIYSRKIQFTIMGIGPRVLSYDMSTNKKVSKNTLLYYPQLNTLHDMNNKEFYKLYYDLEIEKVKYYFSDFQMEKCFYEYYISRIRNILDYKNGKFNEQKLSDMDRERLKKEMQEAYNESKNEEIVNKNKNYIIEYFEYCKNFKIKIIVLFLPFTEFYKRGPAYKLYSDVKEFINKQRNIYDFEILDLSNLCLRDDNFYDYVHLNQQGEELIRKKLEETLK